MNITLFDGRPEDVTGRLPREVRVYDWLDRNFFEENETVWGSK